ncbi:MAG: hypothetical protein NT166_30430 [Candidatus Aminicenantes bacterium]|nr:hypothetical protein [Candidatus Aminicenantes bacterium]
MRRILIFIIIALNSLLFGGDSNVARIGGWGTGLYNDVFTKDHYAYIAAGWNGLDIIDITHPSNPSAVGNLNLDADAVMLHVNGNYAYVVCSDGLHIVDVSIPASPLAAGFYPFSTYLGSPGETAIGIIADGNYAYLVIKYNRNASCFIEILDVANPAQPHSTGSSIYIGDSYQPDARLPFQKKGNYLFYRAPYDSTLEIYDVSNPLSPLHKTTVDSVDKFALNGNYAYIIYNTGLKILNIADPTDPQEVGTYAVNYDVENVFAAGNYLYLTKIANQFSWQLQIIDVSNPAAPGVSGGCTFSAAPTQLTVTGGTALITVKEYGLFIFDVGKPASPRLLKRYDFSWSPLDVFVTGNRSYVVDSYGELKIFDTTTPASPVVLGNHNAPSSIVGISVSGNYAYLATSNSGLQIIDVTDPANPAAAPSYCFGCKLLDVAVKGNYAYLLQYPEMFAIYDLTNPVSPLLRGTIEVAGAAKIHIYGNYALLSGEYGAAVVDITDPVSPVLVTDLYGGRYTRTDAVYARAPYVYVANNSGSLYSLDIFDFSRPAAPVRTGRFLMESFIYDVWVNGDYAYLVTASGLDVMDVSHPGTPSLAGRLDDAIASMGAVTVNGKYIYLAAGDSGRFEILEFKPGIIPAQLRVNRGYLRFYADNVGRVTPPQSLAVDTPGDNKQSWSLETLNWMRTAKIAWIKCSQTGGTGSTEIMVSIDPAKIEEMIETGTGSLDVGAISISAPNALNSGLTVGVSITIEKNAEPNVPFGELATPPANTVVSGSVPVTGWALDNIGVAGVQIYRGAGDQLAFVGDAVFVEGARPDVELRYPDYPNCFKSGWGYMLLTRNLPAGDGPLTLHAVATDIEGNRVTLGTTAITVANANSAKPFGALDTPGQGETVSGRGYLNFGWALTPLPNTIPVDGSTIHAWIDGVAAGQPVYNQYRQDLADLFPGLNNSGGAVGYLVLDTTKYANGVHTIAWSVVDDAGNADGIGSRYFQVRNQTAGSDPETADRRFKAPVDLENIEIERQPVRFKTGFDPDRAPETAFVSEEGVSRINIRELERVEADLGASHAAPGGDISGFLLVGNTHRPLPTGSTLDTQNGIFYWQPGPGFVGTYNFIFVKEEKNRAAILKRLEVVIAAD